MEGKRAATVEAFSPAGAKRSTGSFGRSPRATMYEAALAACDEPRALPGCD